MKTRIASILVLAAALSTSASLPLSAASNENSPAGYSVSSVDFPYSWTTQIARGTSQETVSSVMGQPFQTVSPDVWIYHGYRADLNGADEHGCDIMVITFAQGKVADLKLVNGSAARIIAAHSTFKQTGRYASTR
jgi:hypothetical protein